MTIERVIAMSFKEILISLRKDTCRNAKEFARLAGITYTTYVSYEKGAWPNEENLVKIATALNVSIDQLLNHSMDSAKHEAILARWSGLDVKEENGLYSVEVPSSTLNAMDEISRRTVGGLNLAPLPAADFNSAVKVARQNVIDENSTRFILWILMCIDYHWKTEQKEKPPAE
jgi:transcriptional regulator with XRE-family HTH domain